VLQSAVDKANAKTKINEFLSCLSSCDYIYVPNELEETTVVDEVRKETFENISNLTKSIEPFIEPMINKNYVKFSEEFIKWSGRNVQTTLKKSGEILSDFLKTNHITLNFPHSKDFESIAEEIQHFMLIIYYYSNPVPDLNRILLFKKLLLKDKEKLTSSIDFIIVDSWKKHPDIMYQLTKSWIDSLNPVLIDWLAHGVENPGRNDPQKALNFLKPAFYLSNENVAWIISHVTATIICADPYQTLRLMDEWLQEKKNVRVKEKLKNSLLDLVTDKFEKKNIDNHDFPDLENVIIKIMRKWCEKSKLHAEIGNEVLLKISNL
jgi:hypothetical protein